MTTYQQAHDALFDALLTQTTRRKAVSIAIDPEESLFCEFVVTAFEEEQVNWENDLLELLAKCAATPKQRQRILNQAQEMYIDLSNWGDPQATKKPRPAWQVSRAKSIGQQEVWRLVYQELYYRYRISVGSYKLDKGETKLQRLKKLGYIDKVLVVATNILRVDPVN